MTVAAHVVRPGQPAEDVTSLVEWSTRNPDLVAVHPGGRIEALAVGLALVEGRHEDLSGLYSLQVLADGMFMVWGTVEPVSSRPARVEATGGLGGTRATETVAGGAYQLIGVGGRARLTASLGSFVSQTVEVDVNADLRQDFRLALTTDGPRWTLRVTTADSCEDGLARLDLGAEVAFVVDGQLAAMTPVEQPEVLFAGEVLEPALWLPLSTVADDYYPPGVLVRASDGRRFELFMGANGRRDGNGFAGDAAGYVSAIADPSGAPGPGYCYAEGHRFTLRPR